MSKNLQDIKFLDLLTPSIAGDETFMAAAQALDTEIRQTNEDIRRLALFAQLDELADPILSELAWHLHVDFWDPDLAPESKRDLIRHSIAWHRHKGTPWAIKEVTRAVGYPDARVLEHGDLVAAWKAAGGEFLDGSNTLDGLSTLSVPGALFDYMTNHWAQFIVRLNAGDGALSRDVQTQLVRLINVAKNTRSHLVALTFFAQMAWDARIYQTAWSATVRVENRQCRQFSVPSFDVIGHGCEEIGGNDAADFLDGAGALDGWESLNGRRITGEPLDGGWGDISTQVNTRQTVTAGGARKENDTLDPFGGLRLDLLDGSGDLSAVTLDGSGTLDGTGDLSIEVLAPDIIECLDGYGHLGETPGPKGVWLSGRTLYRQGNYSYSEAL